jgi:hypothetical protein
MMRLKLFILLVIIASAYSNQSHAAIAKTAETAGPPCIVGRSAPPTGFWTWPAGSQVKIYLKAPDFSEADVSAVRVAVTKWDDSAIDNGSNVRFSVHGLTSETKTGQGDMMLVRGDVYDKQSRHLALLQAHSLRRDQLIDYALVIVDFRVKKREVLTSVMAHELGHSLGLLDCYNCNRNTTAMGLIKTADDSNGMEGPSACDTVGVVAAYREVRAQALAASNALSLRRAADQGEEPETDETPVVDRP